MKEMFLIRYFLSNLALVGIADATVSIAFGLGLALALFWFCSLGPVLATVSAVREDRQRRRQIAPR